MNWKQARDWTVTGLWLGAVAFWCWWEFLREPPRRVRPATEQAAVGAYTVGTYTTAGGSVQVLNVVSPDPNFDGLLERRRCLVWREQATGASSMSCDGAGFPN